MWAFHAGTTAPLPRGTIVVYEDFTVTTSGTMSDQNLTVDELGNGWFGAFSATDAFNYGSSNEGIECDLTSTTREPLVETNGREDVRVTVKFEAERAADNLWTGITLRSRSSSINDGLVLKPIGTAVAPNLRLHDGGTEIAAFTGTPSFAEGDYLTLVVDCIGDDITLRSVQVNSDAVTSVNSTITLTSTTKTDHGAGSGADRYGLWAGDRTTPAGWYEFFKVEAF